MKLSDIHRRVKVSKHNNRLFTSFDMATVKHQEAIANSRQKRDGEKTTENLVFPCNCGSEGCFIHHRR